VKKLIFLLLFVLVSLTKTNAQDQKFLADFKQIKLHLANHKEDEAIPILENLFKQNPTNFNIAYLLGYCYVKQEVQIDRAIRLLSVASRSYSDLYDPTSLTEKKVSEYVYYYLIIAYSLGGKCDEAKETLNKFYQIYSYYDEWYLVEGQKWLRECGTHKLKEQEEITDTTTDVAIAEAEQLTKHLLPEGESVVTPKRQDEIAEETSEEKAQSVRVVKENNETTNTSESIQGSKTANIDDANQNSESAPINNAETTRTGTSKPAEAFKDRLTLVEATNEGEGYKVQPVNREQRGVITKTIKYSTPHILYGVQVAAYLEPKFTRDFQNVKNVEVYIDKNGVFRYVIGRFPYKQQAQRLLDYVKEAGYEDAFIVDINGDKYSEEVVSVDNESINRRITGKVDFRVQIGAFKEKIPEHVVRQYLIVDEIKETQVGEFTVLTIGSFNSYDGAAAYRNKMQQIGVEDAFIAAFNYDKKIPNDEAEAFLLNQRLKAIEDAADDGNKRAKKLKEKAEKEAELEEENHNKELEGK